MYAIIETAGKQFKVQKDDIIHVPKMNAEAGTQVEFDSVLLLSNGDLVSVGAPHVTQAKVVASILGHKKENKVIVFKMKRRKGYRRKKGHRQNYTELLIQDILSTQGQTRNEKKTNEIQDEDFDQPEHIPEGE